MAQDRRRVSPSHGSATVKMTVTTARTRRTAVSQNAFHNACNKTNVTVKEEIPAWSL